ncbi:hypothetical protein RB653_009946 [Dictyostelium firmibasis]|uniref:MOSC domain-containing protein n=1 Tax=Dictyostelium firmibasis TaxID=79012 RepID=A0AAN7TT02_9MYCE
MEELPWTRTKGELFLASIIIAYSAFAFYLNYKPDNNNNNNNQKIESPRDHPIRIKKIIIYPIKSCKGVEVRSCKLDKFGFENDRRFMLVSNGRFMSQRKAPKMALIQPKISDDGKWLIVNRIDGKGEELRVLINDPKRKEIVNVGIWKDSVNVVDCGEESSNWFSKFLESDVKLVTMAPGETYTRKVDTDYLNNDDDNKDKELYQVSLCDSAQINILSESSINDLNKRISETRKSKNESEREPLSWESFRPNVLVSGYSCQPFEEDTWEQIRISGLLLKKISPGCPRCKLTTVNPEKGIINQYDDNEPLRTLETYRKFDTGLLFGVEFVHQQQDGEEFSVGDIIDVLKAIN